MAGLCPYGDRCLFIHPEASNTSNPYIRPDRVCFLEYNLLRTLKVFTKI